jgi:V/A-type H+-transporting ATPase subunit I
VAHWIDKNLWHGHPPYASPVHELYKRYIGEAHGAEAAMAVRVLTFRSLYVSLALGSVLLALASWLGFLRSLKERDPEHMLHTLAVALGFTGVLAIFVGSYIAGSVFDQYGLRYLSLDTTLPVIPAMFGATAVTVNGITVQLPASAFLFANIAKALIVLAIVIDLLAPIIYGHESLGQRLILAFVEAFDLVLVLLSNTLSFVRIMGLMLAHSGLMYGFFIIAEKAGGLSSPTGILVYAIGNIFVIGFEAFIANIHTLRLHFYEMFTKFYEGRGRRYQPVRLPPGVEIKIAAKQQ